MQPVGPEQAGAPVSPRAHRRRQMHSANSTLSRVAEHPSPPPRKESQCLDSAWSDSDTLSSEEVPILAYRTAQEPQPSQRGLVPPAPPIADPRSPGARTPVGQAPPMPAPAHEGRFVVDYGAMARQPAPVLTAPVQSRQDSRTYQLPPIRDRAISAPLQPRVFDVRVGIERDPQRANPTFEVHVRFSFSMQPGDLR